jgi:hypothetical protein
MPFNSDTARQPGKKSKRGPSFKISHPVREKLKFVLEDQLDYFINNPEELSTSDRIKIFNTALNYLMPKVPPAEENSLIQKQTKLVTEIVSFVPADYDEKIKSKDLKSVIKKDQRNDPD